jgi:hypothetical protein
MSVLWGTPTQRKRVLFVLAAFGIPLVIPLTGCQYVGTPDAPVQTNPQASAEPTPSFQENLTEGPTSDPRASELNDLRDWASQALKPALPGEKAGAGSSSSIFTQGVSATPGSYELHFLCEGPSEVELSIATWRGVAVLEPVKLPCDGTVFKAPVQLATEGADIKAVPDTGHEGRYAYRLVPSQ